MHTIPRDVPDDACLEGGVLGRLRGMLPLCVALLALPTSLTSTDLDSSAPAFGLVSGPAFPQDVPQLPLRSLRPRWEKGGMVLQGFVGAAVYDTVETSGGTIPDVDGSDEDTAQAPVIGGGAQWKLGGTRVDFGVEAMFAFSWRTNATAISSGGGGATVAVDIDLYLFEIFGGPLVNFFVNDDWRIYASAGPVLQWAGLNQGNNDENIDSNDTGFGTGGYARFGIEYRIMKGTMLGLGARYSSSSIDLGSEIGDLDLDGSQFVLTVTQGF